MPEKAAAHLVLRKRKGKVLFKSFQAMEVLVTAGRGF